VTLALRIVLALAAAWLVVQIANVHQERTALSKFANDPAAARPEARAAKTLNPDPYPQILEGVSYMVAGDRAHAAPFFRRVVRAEPENVRAWALLFQATHSPQSAAAIKRLSPLR
jgi:predicted Zn-dependent protease